MVKSLGCDCFLWCWGSSHNPLSTLTLRWSSVVNFFSVAQLLQLMRCKSTGTHYTAVAGMLHDTWTRAPHGVFYDRGKGGNSPRDCHGTILAVTRKHSSRMHTDPRSNTRMSSNQVAMRLIVNRMTDRRLWKHYLPLRSGKKVLWDPWMFEYL